MVEECKPCTEKQAKAGPCHFITMRSEVGLQFLPEPFNLKR